MAPGTRHPEHLRQRPIVQLTLLGTGTSFGIPQIGCECGVCRSNDPRDRRTRTAALIQSGSTRLLIDTPPEVRLQLVREGATRLDAVLYTHEHADHVTGIDDLRIFSLRQRAALPLYGPETTLEFLRSTFRYIFDPSLVPPEGTSKPKLTLNPLVPGSAVVVGGLEVLPLAVDHGSVTVFGYRIGPIAYLTDVKRVPDDVLARVRGVRILVLSALWWRPHPTHQSIPEAIDLARTIGPERAYLTHLSHETSHAELLARLPEGIEPGYDGLTVEVDS
jgi:phosphoribosyl 1,2-cyclic phosphate phosphodiesterase